MRTSRARLAGLVAALPALAALVGLSSCTQARYDLVIANGRVMDPESGLDAVRNLGIQNGKIAAISERELTGAQTIDARGLIVAPGFIDLHAHGQDAFSAGLQARDGVT